MVLAPEFCNRQTFLQYAETVWESVSVSTHLVVVRNCDVAAVWRDRRAIEYALRRVHVVLLFPEQQAATKTRSYFLATKVGLAAEGSIFSCVDSNEMYKRAERTEKPEMRMVMPGEKDTRMVTVKACIAAGPIRGGAQAPAGGVSGGGAGCARSA